MEGMKACEYVSTIDAAVDRVREYEISTGSKFVAVKGPSCRNFGSGSDSLKNASNG